MKRTSRNRIASHLLVVLAGIGVFAGPAWADDRVKFVGAAPDQEYRDADAKLIALLQRGSGLTFERIVLESNSDAVTRVLDLNKGRTGYVARLTPFACVAAEMLGADFDIIGTYQSKATNAETFHGYFVVNRERFRNTMRANSTDASPPRLFDIPDYLKKLQVPGKPPVFVFHDQFSTASYFLPALWFRNRRIFEMDQPIESLIPISTKRENTSTGTLLVQDVANDVAALAAVGDVAKARFDDTPDLKAAGSLVYFIQHPTLFPNDLLVASHSLGQPAIERIHAAIRTSRKQDERIDVGDFLWWDDIRDANEASAALWTLRRQAAAPPAPVPIRVEDAAPGSPLQELVEASRQAIRLAGTEFVVFDPDFHKSADVVWKLTALHDGAVLLRSSIELPPDVAPQEFTISFSSPEDLTARISALIHNRMNRIRYIWPYRANATILRDVAFALPPASSLKISRITWVDPSRNDFNEGGTLDARVSSSDFYKFQLQPESPLQFNPLSNAAYRTVLVRPPLASAWLKIFSFAFVALLLLALAWTVWALYRKVPAPRALTPAAERRAG